MLEGLDFDGPTLQLERLVEETHLALVRNGLLPPDSARGCRAVDMQSSSATGQVAVSGCDTVGENSPIPSLDAVDRALEELQMGLAEIDSTLGRPGGVGVGSAPAGRPVSLYPHEVCKCGVTFEADSVVCHGCSGKRSTSANPEALQQAARA